MVNAALLNDTGDAGRRPPGADALLGVASMRLAGVRVVALDEYEQRGAAATAFPSAMPGPVAALCCHRRINRQTPGGRLAGTGARHALPPGARQGKAGAGMHHRPAPSVDRRDDLLRGDALQVRAGRGQVRVPRLALDQRQDIDRPPLPPGTPGIEPTIHVEHTRSGPPSRSALAHPDQGAAIGSCSARGEPVARCPRAIAGVRRRPRAVRPAHRPGRVVSWPPVARRLSAWHGGRALRRVADAW